MSINEQPPLSRRYAMAAILAVVCIVGYGISQGWFGTGSPRVEVEGATPVVSQPTDQDSERAKVMQESTVAKDAAKTPSE